MKRSISTLFTLPLAAVLALGACSDNGGNPLDSGSGPNVPSGTMSFNYDGPMAAGSFNVQGAAQFNSNGSWIIGNWALGGRGSANGSQVLAGYATRQQGSKHDHLSFMVLGNATGNYSVSAECENNCAMLGMSFGLQEGSATTFDHVCTLDAGTIRVTSLDANRMRGTINGTGTCASRSGGTAAFQINNGSFDLPIPGTIGM